MSRIGDPGARGVTRRTRATSSRARGSVFSRAPRPVQLPRPRKWNAPCESRGVQCAARRLTTAATRRRGQRNWHRLVPASSGAKASLASEERQLDRVCPRVDIGCRSRRTVPRFRETRIPMANGRVDGNQAPGETPQGVAPGDQRHRRPAPRWPSRGAGRGPSRAFERTSRGRGFRQMEGTPGCNLGWLVHASRSGAA
jgi:hypothetical protein